MKGIADDKGVLFTTNNAIEQLNMIVTQIEAKKEVNIQKYADFIAFDAPYRMDRLLGHRHYSDARTRNPEYKKWKENAENILQFFFAITPKSLRYTAPSYYCTDTIELIRRRKTRIRDEWKTFKNYIQRKEVPQYSGDSNIVFGKVNSNVQQYQLKQVDEYARFMRKMRDNASSVELKEITLDDNELNEFSNAKNFIEENLE